MALEMNDLMALKSMGNEGLSPYESMKLDHMAAKSHTGGVAIAGLTLGVVGTAIGVGAWLFGGMYGNAKANQAKEVAIAAKEIAAAKFDAVGTQLGQLATLLTAERAERIEGDRTLSISINDTVSGQQSGQLTSSQIAQLEQAQQLQLGLVTGKYSENPTKVQIYSAPQPCGCPGCNG
jgi:hypothetical protein